jgi:iron(III) transport system ATP-binding protein
MVPIVLDGVVLAHSSGFRLGPVSMVLPAGGRTALVGPSGCGKTTLLRLIAGLEGADAGRISFGDKLATDGRKRLLPPAERGIGFVFQDGALWPHLDARAQLRFCDPGLDAGAADGLLQRVGLGGKEGSRPRELSGGEQQRLALARALVGRPRVLLLDEPLHSVDVHLRDELSLLIRAVAAEAGLTLVLVTHDRREALAIADHLVVLRAGRIVEAGPAARLVAEPATAFTAAFLGGAACLPVERNGHGTLRTPFGELPAPSGEGAVQLVLLPGDAEVRQGGAAKGRVLQVLPGADADVVTVELAGRSVAVRAAAGLRSGDEVTLALRRPARLLPETTVET